MAQASTTRWLASSTGGRTDLEAQRGHAPSHEKIGVHSASEVIRSRDRIRSSSWEWFAPYIAEYIGSFLLTLIYLCNVTTSSQWSVSSNGLMAVSVFMSLFHISGANLNPSISIALLLAGRHELRVAGRFCFAQIAGGVTAALVRSTVNMHHADFGPKKGFHAGEAMFIELLYTTLVCFVFMNCAAARKSSADRHRSDYSGIAVGLCLIAGGYASSSVSGTVMNPAIAISVQLVELGTDAPNGWAVAYLIPEIFGAVVSVAVYRVVRPSEARHASGMPLAHGVSRAAHQEVRSLLGTSAESPTSSRLMAEFVGTFYLVFTKALNCFGSESHSGEAWSMAALLASLVYSLRDVSGGLFNPAASVAALAVSGRRGRISPLLGLIYSSTQVFAGIIASTVFAIVIARDRAGEVAPNSAFHWSALVVGETVFTCLFCYVTLVAAPPQSKAADSRFGDAAGLVVGFCLAAGNLAVGRVTGSALNPAVALGFVGLKALTGHISRQCLMYIFCEFAGALAAAWLFIRLYPNSEYSKGSDGFIESAPEAGSSDIAGPTPRSETTGPMEAIDGDSSDDA